MADQDSRPSPPRYVDLRSLLLPGFGLWDRLLIAAHRPELLAGALGSAMRGRRAAEAYLAHRVPVDSAEQICRPRELADLRERKATGQSLILIAPPDAPMADRLMALTDLFDEQLTIESAGETKAQAIADHAQGPFEYLTASREDAAACRGASRCDLVERPPAALALLKAMRPMQWVKNGLLFVPLAMSHQLTDGARLTSTLLGFALFSMVASAGYIFNDLLDVPSDRLHAAKSRRPFAAGHLPIPLGLAACGILAVLGFVVSATALSAAFFGLLVLYLALSTLYSAVLKRKAIIDVIVLAGLYAMRLLAGGEASDVELSAWLLAFSVFFFFSLALVKRHAELMAMAEDVQSKAPGRGYDRRDLPVISGMGAASGCLSVLVLAMYINSNQMAKLYDEPRLLWLICPLLLYWNMRMWLLAQRRILHDDPIAFAVRDRTSYIVFLIIAALIVMASS